MSALEIALRRLDALRELRRNARCWSDHAEVAACDRAIAIVYAEVVVLAARAAA